MEFDATPEVKRLLEELTCEMNRQKLMLSLGLKDEKNFLKKYLNPALKIGKIERTVPDKPNNRLQRYRIAGRVNK